MAQSHQGCLTEERAMALGKFIKDHIPDGYLFVLIVEPPGEEGRIQRVTRISNANNESAAAILREQAEQASEDR